MTGARRERFALAAMIGATFLWGGTFVAIRDSVTHLAPAALVTGRFGVAALVLGGALLARRGRFDGRAALGGAATGVLMLGGYLLQAEGLRTTSAGSSAFLTCAGTLLTAFFAWPLLRQRPSTRLVLGIAVAMAGAALLTLDGAWRLGRGEWLTLVGAAVYALQVVALARIAATRDALTITAAQTATVALLLAPFAPNLRASYAALDPAGWARFAYLAIAGSTIAPLLQVTAQRTLPPGRIGLLFALEPVFALAFAVTIGHERFVSRWWIGSALILAGVVWVESRASAPTPTSATR